MDDKKIQEIFSDEVFVGSLMAMDSAEEVQAAVKAKGLDLSIGDIERVKAQLVSGKTDELSAGDLDNVSGGIAVATIACIAACIGAAAGCIGATAGLANAIHNITNRRW